jgi:hypothetical protein
MRGKGKTKLIVADLDDLYHLPSKKKEKTKQVIHQ